MRPERALQHLTALIVQACDPQEVLLFGSYAKGLDNVASDLDILVIGDFRESPHLRGQEVRALQSRYPIRLDLLLMTPEEAAAASREPYGFIRSVLSSAVVLYRKAGKGIDKGRFLRYS